MAENSNSRKHGLRKKGIKAFLFNSEHFSIAKCYSNIEKDNETFNLMYYINLVFSISGENPNGGNHCLRKKASRRLYSPEKFTLKDSGTLHFTIYVMLWTVPR